jgi:hypothetical protein
MDAAGSSASYRAIDYRANSLNQIINGLDAALNELNIKLDKFTWYDGVWFREEAEPIYGLAFVAFQIYINGTIKDLANSSANKYEYYRLHPNFENYSRSKVELIIALANYCKHRDDDGPLRPGTHELLDSYGLNASKEADIIDSSPIFDGLTLLSENWDLSEIISILKDWRTNLLKVTILD